MALMILPFVVGPLENNTYLAADVTTREAVVIDPSFDCEFIADEAKRRGLNITQIWLTHAHFDHFAGAQALSAACAAPLTVGLHRADLELWGQGGGAATFGMRIERGPQPSLIFEHGQILQLGESAVEVRHTPGHTRGHVVFYSVEENAVLCGDLIFWHGVGRTDLPGGSHADLVNSIRTQIFTLPGETRLLCGHGPDTTVVEEAVNNPFL